MRILHQDRRTWQLLVLLVLVGCQGSVEIPRPTTPNQRQRYAELPGLKRSQDPQLKAEYERLLTERATPEWLDDLRPASLNLQPASAGGQPVEHDSPIARLTTTFPAFTRGALADQLAAIYPQGKFEWGPAELALARGLRRRHDAARRQFREDLAAADRGFGLRLQDGPLIDLAFLDALQIGCRLEGAVAADALANDEPDAALEPIGVVLHAAAILSHERHVACRMAAVKLRAEALRALAAAVAHPQAVQATHRRAFDILSAEIADWPADDAAWIGDRAAGLVTYELVRDGYFLSLLTEAELAELKEKQILLVTARTAFRKADQDETFYLDLMRRLIATCQFSYFQRQAELQELRQELAALQDTPDWPLVAGRLLLGDFEQAMRRQAEDLARCRAWSLALRLALHKPADREETNPLTGQAFQVEESAESVSIVGVLEPDEPIVIPRRPEVRTASRRGGSR